MAKIKVDKKRCKGCGLCVVLCPLGHIKASGKINKLGYKTVVFQAKKGKPCTGCSACAIICPEAGIEVFK